MNAAPRPAPWSATTKAIVVVGLLLVLLALAVVLREMIAPLLLAAILAYLLTPLSRSLEKRFHLGRGWAAALVYVLLLAFLAAAIGVLIPIVIDQMDGLTMDLQTVLGEAQALLGRRIVFMGLSLNLGEVLAQSGQALSGLVEPVFGRTLDFAVEVLSSVLWLVFVVVVSFYFVRDRARLSDGFDSLWPAPSRLEAVRFRQEVDGVWRAFFVGQLLLAFVVTLIFAFVGVLVGLPFPLAMAVLAGLLEFVPSLGHGLWMVTAAVLMLIHGSTWLPIPAWAAAALIVGLHLVFQQVDLNYLIPRFVGRRVRLHPAVVIVGVFAGAIVAGVLGIVLAAPLIATGRVAGRFLLAHLVDGDPLLSAAAGEANG